ILGRKASLQIKLSAPARQPLGKNWRGDHGPPYSFTVPPFPEAPHGDTLPGPPWAGPFFPNSVPNRQAIAVREIVRRAPPAGKLIPLFRPILHSPSTYLTANGQMDRPDSGSMPHPKTVALGRSCDPSVLRLHSYPPAAACCA